MTIYFDMVMDCYKSDNILGFRKQALEYWDALTPDERNRVLELCKASEDWSQSYLDNLEPKALMNMLKLNIKCMKPEERMQFREKLRSLLEA